LTDLSDSAGATTVALFEKLLLIIGTSGFLAAKDFLDCLIVGLPDYSPPASAVEIVFAALIYD
jgi:hypothetical protein